MAKADINKLPVDRFTLGHLSVGMLLGLCGTGFWTTLISSLTWELLENRLKRKIPIMFPNPSLDTLSNAVADITAWMLGWAIIQIFPKYDEMGIFKADSIFRR